MAVDREPRGHGPVGTGINRIVRGLRPRSGTNEQFELPYDRLATEAQQPFRFYLIIRGLHVAYIDKVQRPGYTIPTEEYSLLSYKIKNPTGIVAWEPVTFRVKEIFSRDVFNSVAGVFMNKLTEGAYAPPGRINSFFMADVSKEALIGSLGPVQIQMLNTEGEVYERWVLHEAFIQKIAWDELNYNSDSILGATITLNYDWAELFFHRTKTR